MTRAATRSNAVEESGSSFVFSTPRLLDSSTRHGHGLGRVQREAAGKDGQALEQGPLLRRQQVDAPADRVAHRPEPLGLVHPAPDRQRKARLQPGEDRRRRQDADPGRRQLDGERQAVQAAADRCDRRRVLRRKGEPRRGRLGPVHEEPTAAASATASNGALGSASGSASGGTATACSP
jgi:hypothetical protein